MDRLQPPILILGAGVIGLALALELRTRGHSVEVHDPRPPSSQASSAAAGMLAVEDPHNPGALLPLSRLSGSLYPAFLTRVKEHTGAEIPFQTGTTQQTMPDGTVCRLAEHSIDPRQLAPALLQAVLNAGVRVGPGQPSPRAEVVIYTTGAWEMEGLPVAPRKGQMLRVQLPRGFVLQQVHRTEHVYVVPRTKGPAAGTALIGATVEDVGFDVSTVPEDLARLRQMGAALVPQLGNAADAPLVEAWAGLRPSTPDGLPLLGELPFHPQWEQPQRRFVATGHFRNGILLAPGTAAVMADLLDGRRPPIDLQEFRPSRFQANGIV